MMNLRKNVIQTKNRIRNNTKSNRVFSACLETKDFNFHFRHAVRGYLQQISIRESELSCSLSTYCVSTLHEIWQSDSIAFRRGGKEVNKSRTKKGILDIFHNGDGR